MQTDRQDAAAVGFDEEQGHVGTTYEKDKPVVAGNYLQEYNTLMSLFHVSYGIIFRKGQSFAAEIPFRKSCRGK